MMPAIGTSDALRQKLGDAAMGRRPYDLVLENVQYINLETKETYPAQIGIVEGYIAFVTPPDYAERLEGEARYNGQGRFAIPGLIDTHVHMESSMLTPANFARQVLPHGTTTVLADPHEICNVMGLDGMRFCLEASRGLPLDVFFAAPSCVPSVPGVETSHTAFGVEEVAAMLDMERVIALGEVMDFMGVINQSPRMMEVTKAARDRGMLIQGHLAENTPQELAAYLAAGCCSDHEARGMEEAITKLRAGLWLECRYSANCHNMPVLARALIQCGYPQNATACTDDREPDDLVDEGHIDEVLRQAIAAGMPPLEAIRLATRNAARFLGLWDRGLLLPGRRADILLVEDPAQFRVDEVFVLGRLWAKAGKLMQEMPALPSADMAQNTMLLQQPPRRQNFLIPANSGAASIKLHYIHYNPEDPFLTKLAAANFPVEDGHAAVRAEDGFVTMCVFERHGVNGNIGIAPVGNLGMTHGAVAGTVSHDCHNLFVIGTNPDDMLLAAQTLIKSGGGFACVAGGEVLARLELPICGLMSPKTAVELQPEVAALKKNLAGFGIRAHSALNLLTAFSLAVIPEIRLTDCGLVDTRTQQIIPLLCKEDLS